MDFGTWIQNPNSANGNTMNQPQASGQSQTDNASGPTHATTVPIVNASAGITRPGSVAGSDDAMFTNQVEHRGVNCDGCGGAIFGFRYKCLKCPDFDLCATCERRGLHAGHVMMRIAFPEMAYEAVQRYMNNTGSPETPRRGCHGRPGRERHGPPHGEHERHGRRRRHSQSSPDTSDEAHNIPFCPYTAGKKEWKKWAKSFKKTAHVHRRAAEASMRSAASGFTAAAAGASATAPAGAEAGAGTAPPAPPPFDFTQAASQIQEFLNAFGVPIDVVELYDEWGNRGQPAGTGSGAQANPPAGTSGPEPVPANQGTQTNVGTANAGIQVQAETRNAGEQSTQQVEQQFQGLNIGNEASSSESMFTASGSGSASSAPLFTLASGAASGSGNEMEGEGGWTLLDEERIMDLSRDNASGDQPENVRQISITVESDPAVPEAVQVPTVTPAPATPAPSVSAPEASAPAPTVPTSADRTPSGQPIYPTLPQMPPNLQQIMNSVANTVGNATRNIPILPWAPPQRPQQPQAAPGAPQGQPQLNEQMTMTLNQLLSMGFSNHDGHLARLVLAKNGNLDETLNALFPQTY